MSSRPFLLAASVVVSLAVGACTDSGRGAPIDTAAARTTVAGGNTPDSTVAGSTTAPSTLAGRLAQAYPNPDVEPSADAWQALLDDESLTGQPLTVLEFASVRNTADRALYDTFIAAVATAATAQGGELIGVSDIWRNGLELPVGFDGGVVWVATFPSREVYLDVMLDATVVEAAIGRREVVADPHLFVGVNLVPEQLRALPEPGPAEAYPHDLVRGKPSAQVVDELLEVYPDGGPDPTRAVLQAMLDRDDVRTQAISYVNLYAFSGDDTGAAGITEYNAGALPYVLAHGARPKAVFNVAQQLLGSAEWNRVIYVRWPSLEVFTDLRLTPGYIDAQAARVSSSDAYGNLVTIDRTDVDS